MADITTNNIGENDLNPKMKYIMVIIDNWYRNRVQEGWHNTGKYMEQEFYITRINLVEDSNQSVWNVHIKFGTWK